jgi:hypothetical protein
VVQDANSVAGLERWFARVCGRFVAMPRRRRVVSTPESLLKFLDLDSQGADLFDKTVDSVVFHAKREKMTLRLRAFRNRNAEL